MDFLGAVQTEASHEAFRKALNFTNEEDFDDVERYLQSVAVGSRPEESVIRDLLAVLTGDELENEKLRDTLTQTVASMAFKFGNKVNQDFESPIVVEVKNFLMKSMNKCETDDCKVIFIRGLQNLQSPDTIEKLLSLATKFPYQVSVAAMKALRKFPAAFFGEETKAQLLGIFFQRGKKFDSSARTMALDILLTFRLDTDDVVELVGFLKSNDSAFEIKQYLIQKLKMSAEKCSQFNEMLRLTLARDPQVNNWNVYGGVKGLSTALVRRFSQQPSFNGSLLSVQEMKGGVLKRGNVDLLVGTGGEEMSLFTLGLFAGGLSSFISSTEEADPEEDATATAGMELAIQGVQMRPLTFFSGQGELMGHVWSGTASEPTTAYKGVTVLQDHQLVIALNNGAILDFAALGAISIDLNGKIEISLWNKNANSEVVQK
jgi:microsomal triglyceride transfer protein large subunit